MNRAFVSAAAVCIVCGGIMAQDPSGKPPGQLPVVVDKIELPPIERLVASPSGEYVLTLKTLDGWKTPVATASLSKVHGSIIWQEKLPHHQGPRRALVTNAGTVLLIDEWINVVSPYALTLYSPSGHMIAQHPAEEIFTLLAVPRRAIGDNARLGPWITEGPVLSPDSRSARFKAGGKSFSIRLSDGHLVLNN